VKVVIASFGSFGDVNPYVGLGQALKERGHDVTLALPGYYAPFVEAAGLKAVPVRPDIDPTQRDVVRRVMDPLRGAEYLIREVLMPHVEDSFADLDAATRGADVIVSHPLTYALPVLAEHRKIPWASSVLAPLGFFSQSDPPLMAVTPAAAYVQRSFPGFYRKLIPVAQFITRNWGTPVHHLRARLGLPKGADPVHAGQFSPFLNLAMFSTVLGKPQPDWPARTLVTGAVSYDAVHGGLPDEVGRFLGDGPAPVVFTLGSSAVAAREAPRFYQASVDAARDVGARAILLVGRNDGHRPDTGGSADVCVAEWAPHSELFARASVVVHQGGAGTLHTALASGRPQLLVPFAHDQGDNAVRTARLGVGRVIFPSHYGRAAVREHLGHLRNEGEWARNAVNVAAVVRSEDGASAACEALESLASRGMKKAG
jgi:UDP:flavonoid glycosyltransferase YjiC (YdhE family)